MNRVIRLSCLLSGLLLSTNVLAQADLNLNATAEATTDGDANADANADASGEVAEEPVAEPVPEPVAEPEPEATPAPAPAAEEEGGVNLGPWEMDFHGYFRGPLILSLSKRVDPDDPDSDEHLQGVFGTQKIVDGGLLGYSNFGYSRLQEGTWAELLVTAKRKHVSATLAYMGVGYQFVGKRDPTAAWSPGLGWVTLDTDFDLGDMKAHIELKTGAFLSVYGAFGIYDTYLFGRTHLLGEALTLTLPINDNFKLAITHGFGANKNGVVDSGTTALTLAHYLTVAMNISKKFDVGLYYNSQWSNDPSHYDAAVNAGTDPATLGLPAYSDWRDARMRTFGGDIHVRLPKFGHAWLAFSHIAVDKGFALGDDAIEIMHSNGGNGIAAQYLGMNGSGSMNNIGWLYENSVQNIKGNKQGHVFPDFTITGFGLLAHATRDLEEGEGIDETLLQVKGGFDLTFWPASWVGVTFRYDGVNLNQDLNGDDENNAKYHAFTPRVVFKSHFLSSESIYFQVTKYAYGDDFTVESGRNPYDETVFKMQATMGW